MNQEKREDLRQQKEKNKFNSETQSQKIENQNQSHNARKESLGKQNTKY